jgi:ATP adenylyltransferase
VNRLWAPWRITYVGGSQPVTGCVFCSALAGTDDRQQLLLQRGTSASLILNAYPYASGHVMVVVNRHIATVVDASLAELTDAMRLVQAATEALRREYRPDGFNIGINEGRVAGAGVADHLHIHVVPRWSGDVNFMPVLGDVKVLPEALETTYDRLKGALGR